MPTLNLHSALFPGPPNKSKSPDTKDQHRYRKWNWRVERKSHPQAHRRTAEVHHVATIAFQPSHHRCRPPTRACLHPLTGSSHLLSSDRRHPAEDGAPGGQAGTACRTEARPKGFQQLPVSCCSACCSFLFLPLRAQGNWQEPRCFLCAAPNSPGVLSAKVNSGVQAWSQPLCTRRPRPRAASSAAKGRPHTAPANEPRQAQQARSP